MNILYLGPYNEKIINYLKGMGDKVIQTDEKPEKLPIEFIDYIISYGYRHIVSKEIIEDFFGRAINLHISYLPWNRGADPNLWSFLEDTPKGVTIHYLDTKLDCGPIIIQKQVHLSDNETLRSSYCKLQNEMEDMFVENWLQIKAGNFDTKPQFNGGTYHRSKEKLQYMHLLTEGWDTHVSVIRGLALNQGRRNQ